MGWVLEEKKMFRVCSKLSKTIFFLVETLYFFLKYEQEVQVYINIIRTIEPVVDCKLEIKSHPEQAVP